MSKPKHEIKTPEEISKALEVLEKAVKGGPMKKSDDEDSDDKDNGEGKEEEDEVEKAIKEKELEIEALKAKKEKGMKTPMKKSDDKDADDDKELDEMKKSFSDLVLIQKATNENLISLVEENKSLSAKIREIQDSIESSAKPRSLNGDFLKKAFETNKEGKKQLSKQWHKEEIVSIMEAKMKSPTDEFAKGILAFEGSGFISKAMEMEFEKDGIIII